MVERSPNYALVLAVLIATNVAAYRIREKPMPVLFNARLASFPLRLSHWEGQNLEMTQEVRDILNADSLLSRQYADPESGDSVGLLVVYRKYGRRDFIHRPELCYPAQGWKIVGTGYTTLPYDGRNVRATKVVAEKDDAREIIVYWFASGKRTEANFLRQQFRMAFDRFQTQKYGWAFIRINCPVAYSDEETMNTIRGFAATASDPLVGMLTESPRPHAGPGK